MRYFIIGFKNSGKTTLGKVLAQRLQMEFLDLDEYMEQKDGRSIPEIYTAIGEEAFRRLERKALKEVASLHPHIVISTGGGAPCNCNNMRTMEETGEVIYLKVSSETLLDRLKHAVRDRPIVKGKSEEQLKEYISDLRKRCEHHYFRASYIFEGDRMDVDDLIRILKEGKES